MAPSSSTRSDQSITSLKSKSGEENSGREVSNDDNSTRHVLLLGGAGYVGLPIAEKLLNSGFQVTIADNMIYGHETASVYVLSHPKLDFVHYDLCDDDGDNDIFANITDVVVLAGLVGDPITKKYPDQSEEINASGVKKFIKNASKKGLNRLIFISTCSNYGEIPDDVLADENYSLKPLSSYASAKVAQEEMLLNKDDWGFQWTVLRFATAFGLASRMRFDLTVNQFTRELYEKVPLEVFDPDTWRPYCHVQDFARLIVRVLNAPADVVDRQVFNAGGDVNNFTKRMLVEAIGDAVPWAKYQFVGAGSDPRNYRVNFQKVREALQFEPSYSVEDGILEIVNALKNGYFTDIDVRGSYYGNYEINDPK